jgi:hypothetical protein
LTGLGRFHFRFIIHLQLTDRTNRQDLVEQYEKFHYLSGQLTIARQDLSSLLLESLGDSSKRLENLSASLDNSIKALDTAAESQLATTKALAGYSRRLEVFTEALILLTAILSVVGFSNYIFEVFRDQGYTVAGALFWTTVDDFLLILLIFVGFAILLRIGRRKAADAMPTRGI